MHAVARNGPGPGLVLLLLALSGSGWAVTAEVGVAGVAGFLAVSGVGSSTAVPPATGNAYASADVIGEPAPDLTLPSLRPDSGAVELSAYRGKVVYLDFWSSWCAPCRRSMPDLDALRQEFSRQDFEVVGVNVDPLAADARRFLERVPVSYPVGADAAGRAVSSFGVKALPVLFVIDRRGIVRRVVSGTAVEATEDLRATLEQLIEEREVQ